VSDLFRRSVPTRSMNALASDVLPLKMLKDSLLDQPSGAHTYNHRAHSRRRAIIRTNSRVSFNLPRKIVGDKCRAQNTPVMYDYYAFSCLLAVILKRCLDNFTSSRIILSRSFLRILIAANCVKSPAFVYPCSS
jgi:hypothetical protein